MSFFPFVGKGKGMDWGGFHAFGGAIVRDFLLRFVLYMYERASERVDIHFLFLRYCL